MEWWAVLLWCLLAAVMIRAMYQQMGRKPSEAQIRATMNAMNRAK